jgi:SAM-dependent methyltransferase
MSMDYSAYQQMQRTYYESPARTPEQVVGNWAWHEQFPYETFLLFRNGDFRKPVLPDIPSKTALDFGCGPGRMVRRMSRLFKKVDGCDISPRLIDEAKKRFTDLPASEFFLTNGDDLGAAPKNSYDFIYSTIAMQHIAVRSIRMKILAAMAERLCDGGSITLQMGFTKDLYGIPLQNHAHWNEDRISANSTNSGCDVTITPLDLVSVTNDFNTHFKNTTYWFHECSMLWGNLDGTTHPAYWATHWIFINASKK